MRTDYVNEAIKCPSCNKSNRVGLFRITMEINPKIVTELMCGKCLLQECEISHLRPIESVDIHSIIKVRLP